MNQYGRTHFLSVLVGLLGGYLLFRDAPNNVQPAKASNMHSESISSVRMTNVNKGVQTITDAPALDPDLLARELAFREEETRKGGYLLNYEGPLMKKRLRNLIDRTVKDRFVIRGPEYRELLSGMNLKPEVAEKLVKHAEKIYKASMETEAAIQQLALARNDFAKRLGDEISDEDWNKYRDFEVARQVDHESESIKKYFWENLGTSIDSTSEATLKQSIRETEAYTEKLAPHGPLDSLPNLVVGQEAVLKEVQKDIQQLSERSALAIKRAMESGLAPEHADGLAAYYQSKLQELERIAERTRNLHNHEPHEEMANARR